MEDLDMTMEEYVQYETEKALRNSQVYNCETAKYGKISWCLDDVDINILRFFKTKFPAIVYNDALISELEFSSEPIIQTMMMRKIDIKQSSGDISIEPLHNVISIDIGTYEQG
ncbi:hypothetical protein Tco_0307210 [Tanacetum coccineum]